MRLSFFRTHFLERREALEFNYYVDHALAKADVPRIRSHGLRHGAATALARRGDNARMIQEMLGHSTASLTLGTYSHVSPAMHREAADRMDALFTYRKHGL